MSVRVLVADDHEIVREGLCALLEQVDDVEVIGEAENGRMSVKLARELTPDVVVMDVAMPDLNGIEATRQIRAASASIKVIALSMHSDKRFVQQMLLAGASGYLRKGCGFEELVRAIRTVVSGQTYLSPQIAGTIAKDYTRRLSQTDSSSSSILTTREREVLQLLAEGKIPKQIASLLGVSPKMVSTHRWRIMKKVGINSLAGLVKYAIREGLTSLEG